MSMSRPAGLMLGLLNWNFAQLLSKVVQEEK